MPSEHALLSSSSSKRWLNCPPSARLCEAVEDSPSPYAEEGTDAHTLCQYKLELALGMNPENPVENLTYYNQEMDECAENYKDYVLEVLEEIKQTCSDPLIFIEQKLDYSKWVEGGFGTGDCVIVADGVMHIIDYKHGKGVKVDSQDNPQMKLYALGALAIFDGIYDINSISMTIFQPRLANVSERVISKDELLDWAENILVPKAKLAYEGKGDFVCGEWCQFCKVKQTCRKRAEANMQLAKFDFQKPPLIEDSEIEEILPRLDALAAWVEDIKAYALAQALSGHKWKGYKVVEGRANRKYTDEKAVAATVSSAGYDPFEKKLLGITEMQKMLGKNKFEELLSSLVIKPQGKPTLAPDSDKRPEFTTAKAEFNDNTED